MKQHINKNQLDELSEKGKHKLDVWYHDECDHICHEVETDIPRHNLPLLSIGQLIEFLDKQSETNWEIRIHKPLFDVNYPDSSAPDYEDYKELCNALWQAVKEVLES